MSRVTYVVDDLTKEDNSLEGDHVTKPDEQETIVEDEVTAREGESKSPQKASKDDYRLRPRYYSTTITGHSWLLSGVCCMLSCLV